jgi:hypothetical protein
MFANPHKEYRLVAESYAGKMAHGLVRFKMDGSRLFEISEEMNSNLEEIFAKRKMESPFAKRIPKTVNKGKKRGEAGENLVHAFKPFIVQPAIF